MNGNAADREEAIGLLSCSPFSTCKGTLSQLLAAEHPLGVQLAALDALGGYAEREVADIVIAHWPQYTPEVLDRAIQILLGREEWTLSMLEDAEKGEISLSQLDSTQRGLLLGNSNAAIQGVSQRLWGEGVPTPRQEIIERYQSCLQLVGDAAHGEQVFTKTCAACHSLAGKGHAVGPDLTSIGSLDPAATLVHILDPNRYVLPKYVQYVVQDVGGRIHTGLVGSQTATSVTLVREGRRNETILRDNIEKMFATGKSMMPEGLEKEASPQDMADLIAYISAARRNHGVRSETELQAERDFGTLPGLVEP